jgi:bifunctional DNase/RNase
VGCEAEGSEGDGDVIKLVVDMVGKVIDRNECVVRYREQDGDRYLQMSIGSFESSLMHRKLYGLHPNLLLTYDYFVQLMRLSDVNIQRVFIHTFLNNTYYAQVIGSRYKLFANEEVKIDCRPSDATLVALHFGVPIYTSERVMDDHAISAAQYEADAAERASFDPYHDFWQNFIDLD